MSIPGLLRRRPLVSVAMTSFNHAPFVAEAIESVLGQTLSDLELIVVDDGSSDGSAEVVAGILDPRLKFIRLDRNRERHARNTAIGLCRGRYVAFQNSDDRWKPQKLEHQVAQLERDRSLSACFTSAEIINAEGEPDASTRMEGAFKNLGRSRTIWLRTFFDQTNCVCFPSAVVRSEDLKRSGPMRGSLVQLADYDLWVRLAAIGDFLVLEEALTDFRVLGDRNLSAPSPQQKRRSRLEKVEVLLRFCEPILLRQAQTVFSDLTFPSSDAAVRRAALARYASQANDPPKRLFADRVWQGVFDDPKAREAVTRRFGPEMFHEYLDNRSTLTFSVER
jgi:glycosyltransferase involved in cell wall biosynthesis